MGAKITVEKLVIPTYPAGAEEEMPMFAENRVHQRSTGRPYPNKVVLEVDHSQKSDKEYTAVHMENEFLDVWILPEIGGRIFAAQDKTTGYDFFYRQHVIKPALIGALGSWISGGVEFNWPYHHRPSGYMPCDFSVHENDDGSVVCWLSEHDPVDRMKGTVGIILRPGCAYLETRMKLTNRTPVRKSFLWWENAAVPVNEQYQIFFPKDVTYVNFHYLDSRISYPIAGDGVFNGIDMKEPRDISMHKNTRDATSYFACASKYDFFGGYDHGKGCGVVHIADHHIAPGKKMFTWAYNQLSKSWENALTDTDGQYAELMAGSYTDNQPNFSWLEPYETKEFSQFWYPINKIGTPDYADLNCAVRLDEDAVYVQSTVELGKCRITAQVCGETVLDQVAELAPCKAVKLEKKKMAGLVTVRIDDSNGKCIAKYAQENFDELKMPPVKDPMPLAAEMQDADEMYRAGVHVEQYRDPAVMPDAYWLKALERNPKHVPSMLAMANYCYNMQDFEKAKAYAEGAIKQLTKFNERLENGDAYYMYALILEAMEDYDKAYDYYYKAAWSENAVSKAMARLACLDMRKGDTVQALRHAEWALEHNVRNPIAAAVKQLIDKTEPKDDPWNLLSGYLKDKKGFFNTLCTEAAQVALDIAFDLESMGQTQMCVELLENLFECLPDEKKAMPLMALAYYKNKLGMEFAQYLEQAEAAPVGLRYPDRREEARILKFASENGSSRAKFLLGCLVYDKRHYAQGAELFEQYTRENPQDYMGWRCLAIACFSHMGKRDEAVEYMKKAVGMCDSDQLLYELSCLMDKVCASPEEKIELLTQREFKFDNLKTQLAKAYNQNRQPEKALQVLMEHTFTACEGGEHSIADQYMFAYFLMGNEKMAKGDFAAAKADFAEAIKTLPKNLGAGIWNRCKYVPYKFRMAECMEKLGDTAAAQELYREILGIEIEFFSNMHLKELPFYQALCADRLGLHQKAQRIMGNYKRIWQAELERKDNGFFTTTPFFISFVDKAEDMRRAQYLYLLGLVDMYDGKEASAKEKLIQSYSINQDNMFCGFYSEK